MNFDIQPYSGVGPIRFEMSIDDVRNVIGAASRPFHKTADAKVATDAFMGLGIHVHYKPSGKCEAVEFGGPAIPTLQGRPLLGVPFNQLLEWIKSLDSNIEIHETGLTSNLYGIGIYMSSMDDLDEESEGVIVFEKGYYD